MQSKSKQGALSCGLVLMLAATVPAMPTAAVKKLRSLEPSVQQKMDGLLLDEERRAGECTQPAPGNKCPRTSENCNQFYISEVHEAEGKHEAVMCRNPPGSFWRGKNNDRGRQCTDRSAGKFLGKARKVCPGDKKSLLNPAFLVWAAHHGNVGVVRILVAVDGIEVNKRDSIGDTALMKASRWGHVDVVRMLLAVDGIDVNKVDRRYGDTALIMASRWGHVDVARMLVNHAGRDGDTALMKASRWGQVNVVRMLLAVDGIEVNHAGRDGLTALMMASLHGHVDVVRMLLAVDGIDVNKADRIGWTALVHAREHGRIDVERVLLAVKGIEGSKVD